MKQKGSDVPEQEEAGFNHVDMVSIVSVFRQRSEPELFDIFLGSKHRQLTIGFLFIPNPIRLGILVAGTLVPTLAKTEH